MAQGSRKVVVTNKSALVGKYGNEGWKKISEAVAGLAAADEKRGIATKLVLLDGAALGGKAVKDAASSRQNKEAVDAVWKAEKAPDYLMILGGPDVVPFQDLVNPMYTPGGEDDDALAMGDLPYACEAKYSRKVSDFLGPTRVVGRLPDLGGEKSAAYLVDLLEKASKAKSLPLDGKIFSLSTETWEQSTRSSLNRISGSDAGLRISPPQGTNYATGALAPLIHFVNCHGGSALPAFFGEDSAGNMPQSMHSMRLAGIRQGCVAAFECCYGAQLYPPSFNNGIMGISEQYLSKGAYGVLGSTTIAYGPADSNTDADLICAYFLKKVRQGASLGRAALEARQDFVQAATVMSPTELKTLGQFILLGDPSIHPVIPSDGSHLQALKVAGAKLAKGKSGEEAYGALARTERRAKLSQVGISLGLLTSFANADGEAASTKVQKVLKQLQKSRSGMEMRSFSVSRHSEARKIVTATKGISGLPDKVHLGIQRVGEINKTPMLRVVVVHEVEGRFIARPPLLSR